MPKINLQTPTSRARLAPRGKPYKVRLIPGVHLAYRAAQSGTGSWLVIASDGKGGQWQKVFGHADDKQPSDGVTVLDYEQAALRCRAIARGDANAASDRPATIAEALDNYEADLAGRGRSAYNARWVRHHLPPHLATQPVAQVTAKQLRSWRDALIKGGMLPATCNRVMKPSVAAFNLAATLDPRVAANREAWRTGLAALPNTVKARNAVLTDAQVAAVVRAAYDVSHAFGLFTQTHAETGARSSQLARLTVGDLQRDRLLVPPSHKGRRAGGNADRIPVPLAPSLQTRLAAAAAGREASAPLLTRADGKAWQSHDHARAFRQAARAARLPAGTTIYALRHSSIARMLLRGLPIKLAADLHDTSTSQIEAHYGKYVKHHADNLIRALLLDTSPEPAPAKVVALAKR